MSRIANAPVELPKGVEATLKGADLMVKGPKGAMELRVHTAVEVEVNESRLAFKGRTGVENNIALAGTMRSLANNIVIGVTNGFERKLDLVGVGYRAQMKGNVLSLALGFSHPVEYPVPAGLTIETPSQTEIVIKGIDKQQVGQTAAVIRAYRPPEPYKGKGVKYSDEVIVRKEAKKK